MKVIIIRHGKVDHHWPRACTSKEYDEGCTEYDSAPVISEKIEGLFSGSEDVYVSTLRRTADSAFSFFHTENVIRTDLIDEVPRRSCFDSKKRLPVAFWNAVGRLQWLFGSRRQEERLSDTASRAREFIKIISERSHDCIVVTHGCYMQILQRELKKAGFRFRYRYGIFRNGEYIIAETENPESRRSE